MTLIVRPAGIFQKPWQSASCASRTATPGKTTEILPELIAHRIPIFTCNFILLSSRLPG